MVKRAGSGTWREVSNFHYLSDQEIEESLQSNSKIVRSVRLDAKSFFLCAVIPCGSPYQTDECLFHIRNSFLQAGIKLSVYLFEGDCYLYIHFSDLVSTADFSDKLRTWFDLAGFDTNKDSLHVLSKGDSIPIPLQLGFTWFDGPISRNELSIQAALERFLTDLSQNANLPNLFDQVNDEVKTDQHLEYSTTSRVVSETVLDGCAKKNIPEETSECADNPAPRPLQISVQLIEDGSEPVSGPAPLVCGPSVRASETETPQLLLFTYPYKQRVLERPMGKRKSPKSGRPPPDTG